MKKMNVLLFAVILCFSIAGVAASEPMFQEVILHPSANVQLYGFTSSIASNSYVFYGTKMLPGTTINDRVADLYEDAPAQSESFAMAVDAKGATLWEVSIPNSGSINTCSGAWIFEDGRTLLRLRSIHVLPVVSYVIVDKGGTVVETFSSEEIMNDVSFNNLSVVYDGLIDSGKTYDETGAGSGIHAGSGISLLNKDRMYQWTVTDTSLEGCIFDSDPFLTEDSYIFSGTKMMKKDDATTECPAIAKVSKEGVFMWLFLGSEYSFGRARDAVQAQMGDIYFISDVDPLTPSPVEGTIGCFLVKLNSSGEHVWTNDLSETGAISSISSFLMGGEQMVAAGYDGSGAVVIIFIDLDGSITSLTSTKLVQGSIVAGVTSPQNGISFLCSEILGKANQTIYTLLQENAAGN